MKEGWEYKKFEDCLIKAAKAKQVQASDYKAEGKYPIISQEDKMVSGYCNDLSLLYHINNPIVIFGDHTRVLKFVDFNFVVGADGVKILIPKVFLIAKFLFYYLQWYKVPSLGYSRHYKLLKEINIPIPPLTDQERIVSELDLLTSIINKQKAQLKELDSLAQSIFYDMFGDPIENPKGWEVKKLGDLCNSELGKTLNQSKDTGTLRPYLCAINIQWNKIIKDNLKQTRFEETELERYSVKKGDLLICEGGDIGRAAIWNENKEIQYQNALHRLRFGEEMLPIFCLFNLKYLKDKGILDNRYGKGVTIKHLIKSALLSIPFIVPPLSLQQSFASKVETIEAQKALITKSMEETQRLFDSRMDYWFA